MLDKILDTTRRRLASLDRSSLIEQMRNNRTVAEQPRSLRQSIIDSPGMAVIAEIKRRSPSRGALAPDLSVEEMAQLYERAGACAISVLTEPEFFHGSIKDLEAVRKISHLPILRKDFILDDYQVWESKLIGADAILLIAGALTSEELTHLYTLARDIDLEVLIEIHAAEEIEPVLAVQPEMIGINNRDLKTFNVDLRTTERIQPLLPPDVISISESGIAGREDIVRLLNCNVNAVLVGEALVTSKDPLVKIRELKGVRA